MPVAATLTFPIVVDLFMYRSLAPPHAIACDDLSVAATPLHTKNRGVAWRCQVYTSAKVKSHPRASAACCPVAQSPLDDLSSCLIEVGGRSDGFGGERRQKAKEEEV